jgi:transforming growth factor-beta-induced protein
MAAGTMPDVVAALLSYHVLNGTFPASAFTPAPAFVPTLLSNASYTNVTGGQRVEGYLNGTSVIVVSGALSMSMVTTAVRLKSEDSFSPTLTHP